MEDKQIVGIALIFLGILGIVFGYVLFEDADNFHYGYEIHLEDEVIMEGFLEGMKGLLGMGCFLLGTIFLCIGISLICKIL